MNRFLKGPRAKYDNDETLSFRCRRSEDGRVRVDGKKKKADTFKCSHDPGQKRLGPFPPDDIYI